MHMYQTLSARSPGKRLSRRSAVGMLATGGAATAVAATGLGVFRSTAQAALSSGRSSLVANQKGAIMTEASPTAASTPLTVVLVHGAFADGSGWAGVIAALAGKNLTVAAPPNPLRGISADAAYIASFVQQINGPVLLVGHSYGGAVITNAASQVDNVVGLVYVDAFIPDQDESLQDLTAHATDSQILPALRPAQYPSGDAATPGTEFAIDRASFHSVFCADVPDALATVMEATQRPLSGLAFGEPTQNPAWRTLPAWAIFGTADVVIGVTGLRFMANRAKATTVEVDGGSHVVMISQPQAVTDVIMTAIDAVA
jgi:pimeloyl-ACP methyl ester carboxylesterase